MKLNSRRKKIETKYIVLFIILGVCVIIGLLSLIIKDDRPLSFVEKGIKDIGIGVSNILYTPVRFVTDKIDNYKEMKRIYQKYKGIDEQDNKSSLLEEENIELKQSLEELKKALDLNKLLTDYEKVNATIINRNIGNWYNTLTIDKGEKNGLKTDEVVITNEGLIGKIIKTSFYTSEVKIITTYDLNNKISVGIRSGNVTTYGLLTGYDINEQKLMVTDIIDNTTIKVGDKVTTSGLSNAYPKGLLIGTVSKIESDEFGISKTIRVQPAVDFNNLRYVTVIKELD